MSKKIDVERRKYWQEMINAWQNSGKNGFAWCKENNINNRTFYRWRSFFNQNIKPDLKVGSFVELKNSKDCILEIEYKKCKLRLKDFSFKDTQELIKILKAL